MNWVSHSVVFLCGALVFWVSSRFELVPTKTGSVPNVSYVPPEVTYSDFISVLLTVVTIVLAGVGLAVAVVATLTVNTVKEDAREVAERAVEARVEEIKTELEKAAAGKSLAELEEDFYPEDNEER